MTIHPLRDALVIVPFVIVAYLVVRYLLAHLLPDDTSRFIRNMLVAGFALRVLLALVLHYTNFSWILAPDENTFSINGAALARYWQGTEYYPLRVDLSTEKLYFYFNAVLFWLFGYVKMLPKIINCGVGIMCSVYAYKIARGLFGRASGQLACVLVTFFPSLILWTVVNIRDAWCILAVLVIMWSLMCLRVQPRPSQIASVLLWLAILGMLRESTFAVVAMATTLCFLAIRGRSFGQNAVVASVVITALVAAGVAGVVSTRHFSSSITDTMSSMQEIHEGLSAGSGVYGGVGEDISTPSGALQWLPRGMVYFLFGPFPWQAQGALQLITLPEVLAWYFCMYYAIVGTIFSIKHGRPEARVLLIFMLLLTLVFSLVEGNVGTAYRHRAQILPVYLIFAALGMYLRHSRGRGPGSGPLLPRRPRTPR